MRQLLLCLLLIIFSLGVYSQNQKLNLQGAWKLISYQEIENGKISNAFPGYATIDEVKIWSGNYVMFVSHYKSKKHDNDDYGSGTWKTEANKYEELFTITNYSRIKNQPLRLKLEMKGDTLVQTFPLNEKFEVDSYTRYISKYLKINQ